MIDEARKDFDSYEKKALAFSVNKNVQTVTTLKKEKRA